MTVITVNSSQSLMNAVASAKDGDVIKLAAGTYSGVVLSGANFLKGVTITSADPLHQAVLTDLMINKSSGLTIQGLDLVNTKNIDLPFQISASSNIVMDHLDVTGTGNTVAALNSRLMIIRNSTNVQVTNSEFAYGWHGISMLNNKQITIADNYFHDLRTDGVRGGANSNLTIKANVFTNFHPTATDHPDAIQLWTINTSGVSSNVTIDQNIIYRGTGSPIQGIFLQDNSGKQPFTNLTVTNNVIEGARFNGIAINGALNGTLANNIVQAFGDQPSGIRMQGATGVTVSGNHATTFFTSLKGIDGTAGNALINIANDQGGAMIASWLSQHSSFISAWQASDPAVLYALTHLSGGSVPTPTPSTGAAIVSNQMTTALALNTTVISTDDDTAMMDDDDDSILTLHQGMVISADDIAASGVNVITIDSGARGAVDATAGTDLIAFAVSAPPATNGRPVVVGFESGVDKILVADDSILAGQSPLQSMTFIGTSGFTGHAGEIRFDDRSAGTIVQADVDGDGIADLDFILRDVHGVSASDFII